MRQTKSKDVNAVALGRRGGLIRSHAKKIAAKRRAIARAFNIKYADLEAIIEALDKARESA